MVVLLVAACGSTEDRGADDEVESGLLGEALQRGDGGEAAATVSGVGATVTVNGTRSSLGLFDVEPDTELDLEIDWTVSLDCPDCGDGESTVEVTTAVFADALSESPPLTLSASAPMVSGTGSEVELSTEPVALPTGFDDGYCLLLLSSVQVLVGEEPVGVVHVESIYQLGVAEADLSCSLAAQVGGAAGDWEVDEPDDAFECGFGRLLAGRGGGVEAEVNACDAPQLLVAVPIDGADAISSCCFHWYGVPAGQPGAVLRRSIDDLPTGRWRTVLLVELPDPGSSYEGPYVIANWPEIVVDGSG